MSRESGYSDMLARGDDAFHSGDYDLAVELYSLSIKKDPMLADGWCNRAQVYMTLHQPLDAWGDAMFVTSNVDSENVRALLLSGRALQEMQLFDAAREAYSKCIPLQTGPIEERESYNRLKALDIAELLLGSRELPLIHLIPHKPFYRAEKGGPRDPAVVIEGFRSRVKSRLVKMHDLTKDGKGIGMIAARDISKGDSALFDQPLLVGAWPTEDGSHACYHCGGRCASAVIRCACDRVFCGPDCKKSAMTAYHAPLCAKAGGFAAGIIERVSADTPVPQLQVHAQIIWKLLGAWLLSGKPSSSPVDLPPFCYLNRFTDLSTVDEKRPTNLYGELIMNTWTLLHSLLKEEGQLYPEFTVAWVAEAEALLCANVMDCVDVDTMMRSCAVLGTASFINHSCVANTVPVCTVGGEAPGIRYVAIRKIKKGEEVTVPYFDITLPYLKRRQFARDTYNFTCSCSKCVVDASKLPKGKK